MALLASGLPFTMRASYTRPPFSSRSIFVQKQPGAAERREDGEGLQERGLPCGDSCPWEGSPSGPSQVGGGGGCDGDWRVGRSCRCRPRYIRTNVRTERTVMGLGRIVWVIERNFGMVAAMVRCTCASSGGNSRRRQMHLPSLCDLSVRRANNTLARTKGVRWSAFDRLRLRLLTVVLRRRTADLVPESGFPLSLKCTAARTAWIASPG